MMHRVALMIESSGGFEFRRGGVQIPVTPRKGAKVDLGVIFGLKPSASNRTAISSIFRTVNGQGKMLETAILFDADNVSDEVMALAITEYNKQHSEDR